MDELAIRRNRGLSVPRYQGTGRAEKAAGGAQSKPAAQKTVTVSETLRQLMSRVSQAESHTRESRRTLQKGESVLDEVQDSLERMAELARKASADGNPDRAALQEELNRLREGVDRMITAAAAGDTKLFVDGDSDTEGAAESLLYAADQTVGETESAPVLPDWLTRAFLQGSPTPESLLAALGLDKTASASELLAAVTAGSLEHNPAVGYLAAVYLGSVIAGSDEPSQAMEGLNQLLEKLAEGVPLDRAIELLTQGEFTGLEDFQSQFSNGTAPGLEEFLTGLLLSDGAPPDLTGLSLSALLTEIEGMNLDLLMGLLTASQTPGAGPESASANSPEQPLQQETPGQDLPALKLGNVQVLGRDLSGVTLQSSSGALIVSGGGDVMIRGTGQGEQTLVLTGSGRVTLQNVSVSTLTADGGAVQIFSAGENTLGQVRLEKGASLTLDGAGLLKIGVLRADPSNTLRLTGGAVIIQEEDGEDVRALTVPILVDGSASLAARAITVSNPAGKALEPFDVVWKTLLPGWSAVTAMESDGRPGRLTLFSDDPLRLWLAKGDPSHGYPIHTLVLQGRDESGRPRTRYAYLHWNQNAGAFQEISMYPNPFSVTGGEPGRDWIYEEESHTLRILSSKVTAISGGTGVDAACAPFSGRITLADGIGAVKLSLEGVVCRVDDGKAFCLGSENDVTLILGSGTSNLFASGAGFSGISLGEGTSLCIDCTDPDGNSDGVLTATGGAGSAGIGWEGLQARRRAGRILIRGGTGIGTDRHGFAGSVTIVGGMIASTGGRGGGTAEGISLQMGEDTVTLPQFRLSAGALRLDSLSVETQEYAKAAGMTLDADRRWVAQIQAVYSALYTQLDQSFGGLRQYISTAEGLVRDGDTAGVLLEHMRRTILLQSSQAMLSHSGRGEDVRQLLG